VLPLATRDVRRPLRRYVGTAGGRRAVVRAFDWACSPARMRVRVAPRQWLTLRLHSSDGLRQSPRARGLDDVPREYNGAIEVPRTTWRRLGSADPRVRRWVEANLHGRFTTAPLAVTATRMRFTAQCWELTLGGRPARPDQVAVPPDPAIVVGRLTEMQQDGRTPSAC
jgi:hypothetical protein